MGRLAVRHHFATNANIAWKTDISSGSASVAAGHNLTLSESDQSRHSDTRRQQRRVEVPLQDAGIELIERTGVSIAERSGFFDLSPFARP